MQIKAAERPNELREWSKKLKALRKGRQEKTSLSPAKPSPAPAKPSPAPAKPMLPKSLGHGEDFDRFVGYGAFNHLNSFSESQTSSGMITASTGCELTDAIFDAAHNADIVPQEFFDEMDREKVME